MIFYRNIFNDISFLSLPITPSPQEGDTEVQGDASKEVPYASALAPLCVALAGGGGLFCIW